MIRINDIVFYLRIRRTDHEKFDLYNPLVQSQEFFWVLHKSNEEFQSVSIHQTTNEMRILKRFAPRLVKTKFAHVGTDEIFRKIFP